MKCILFTILSGALLVLGDFCIAAEGKAKLKTLKLPSYQVVESRDYSIKAVTGRLSDYSPSELKALPMSVRKVYRIVVPFDVSKEQLKSIMKDLLERRTEKNPEIDAITIFAYDRKEDAKSVFTFGSLEWGPNGQWGGVCARIARSNDRSSYKCVFTIRDKVGVISKKDLPSKREFMIHDVFDKALYSDPDTDEKVIEKKVAKQLGISVKELSRIWLKVASYKLK